MKNYFLKIFFAFLTISTISQICLSQDQGSPQKTVLPQETEARLIDEFGKLCSEDLAARYDVYLGDLLKNPAVTAYIVFHGDKSIEGTNLNFIAALTNYLKVRGFDASRFKILRGENQDEMFTQFWLVPAGASPPKIENDFVMEKISATIRFDKSWADFYKPLGKTEIYSNYFTDWGCDFSPNVGEFSRVLLSDENLTGYLVIYGNKKSRAEKVVKFAVNDLIKNHKIPRNRLKTIYGGESEEPQIEFWFVPKNDKPPVINSK